MSSYVRLFALILLCALAPLSLVQAEGPVPIDGNDAVNQTCTYTCNGTPILCPDMRDKPPAECINGCCVYEPTECDNTCTFTEDCGYYATCMDGCCYTW